MPPYEPGPGDPPSVFGPYEVLDKLARGGMGTVYLVRDPRLDRQAALKVSRYSDSHRPDLLKRFYHEARAAARLQHPNLCAVYEVGAIDGVHYLTMPYLEGTTLASLVHNYVARPAAAAALAETLAWAIAFAHARDVVHRDLKPVNIMMVGRDRLQPVIVDFGVALRLDGEDDRLTVPGQLIGTVAYMAPEQHAAEPALAGPACDIYSLGVILYELLTGAPPFEGSAQRVRDKKLRADYRPLSAACPEAGPALDAICRRALAPAAADRFATMTAFAEALAQVSMAPGAMPAAAPTRAVGTQPTASTVPPDLFTLVRWSARASRAGRAGAPKTVPHDAWHVPEEVVGLLRRLGWEERLTELRACIGAIEDRRQRGLLQLYAGWLAGERGAHAEAHELLTAAAELPELTAWALAAMALTHLRDRQYAEAHALLDRAVAGAAEGDGILQATLAHCRGSVLLKEQRFPEALEQLYAALEGFGPDHFGTGRVLDTLGMIYAYHRDDFTTAYRFYQRALELKERHDDMAGLAVTHGQLGRLCLDWGELDWAEEHFRKDLDICRRINNRRGEAQMYNHLGQVLLAHGRLRQALDFLNESVKRSAATETAIGEAYARKDRARVLVQLNRAPEAEADARRAEELFAGPGFLEGVWHARRALALARAAQGDEAEAERLLCRAAAYFGDFGETAEAARTWLDLARTRRQSGSPSTLQSEALEAALEHAEVSRRDALLAEIEAELRETDEAALHRRLYRRARGRGIREDTTSLRRGSGERVTVLFLDLRDFSGFALAEDANLVMVTLNQIFAELAEVLERHAIVVNQYLGDGFMALVRGDDHARRAVAAGLDMHETLTAFNRPRRVLGLPPLQPRIGAATGDVHLANVGTHRKIDFTAVGPTTNLAARLQGEAMPASVCVPEPTYTRIRSEFAVASEDGRLTHPKGMGEVRVWDVVGRRATRNDRNSFTGMGN